MATILDITQLDGGAPAQRRWYTAWPRNTATFCRRKPLGAIGGGIVFVMLFSAVFVDLAWLGNNSPLLAPSGYDDQTFGDENLGPSSSHLLGTDELGRDILSRILYGARIAAVIGFATVVLAGAGSLAIGTASGYYSGWLDTIIQRVIDIILAIPGLVLLIFALTVFASRAGPYGRMFWIVIILSVIITASSARVVRGGAIAIANNQYIDAARTIGATNSRIIIRHIAPNVIPIVLVLATVQLGAVILVEAAISFLGLGIPPPFPSWGAMLSINGTSQFRAYPMQAVWPGLAIALAVYGFNMLGDALRDVLDPRLRGSR